MSIELKRGRSCALIVVVALAMLFSAFAMTAQLTPGAALSSRTTLPANSVREESSPGPTCGQAPVPLASAATYAVLAGTSVTNTGPSALTGDLGVSPGSSVTGFPPGTYTGTKNVANPAAAGAESDLTIAYNDAAGRTNCPISVAGNLGGQTLAAGLYKSTSSLAISSGDLTLNGGGNPNAIFVFQVASTLTTTSGRAVFLTNSAQAGNVYWQIGSSATIGTTSTVQGTILAYASVTMASGAHLNGRALARTGDVTLAATTVVVPPTTTATTYAVTFTEGTLPAGTSWSATLNGVLNSSLTGTIGFNVANGNYPFTIGIVAGYSANPTSGSVPVSGAAANQAITFTVGSAATYGVTFTESGLPSGMGWSVTLGVANSSSTSTIGFIEPNGNYAFTVSPVAGYNATPVSGSLAVNGQAATQGITFTATGGGNGTGGGGGTTSLASEWWFWAIIGVLVVTLIAIVVAVVLTRRTKPKPREPQPPA